MSLGEAGVNVTESAGRSRVGLESKAAQCDFTPFCTRAHRLRLPRHQYRLTGEHDV
jgi:hypothetical protein